MKRGFVITIICLSLLLIFLVSFVFAGLFYDFWNKITGNVVEGECTDSDGGLDYHVKGEVIDKKGNRVWDHCEDSVFLIERECISNVPINSDSYGDYNNIRYECPNGCNEGACVGGSEEIICTDGTLAGQCSPFNMGEYCDNSGNLVDDCTECGCASGYECDEGGGCMEEIIQTGKCSKIFGDSDPSKTMNLFIVPVNYPADKLLYGKPYNLDDFSINFENDVYRLLFSKSEELGYGLLTIEPFISNLDSVNIFILPEEYYFECVSGETPNYATFFPNELKECEYYDDKDYVHVLIGEKQSVNNGCLGYLSGNPCVSITGREHFNGYGDLILRFLHELGHQFGLRDIYGPPYYEDSIREFYIHNEWAESWDIEQIYNNFWDYYEDRVIGKYYEGREHEDEPGQIMKSNEQPNCDFHAGCPKWCRGDPLIKLEEINPCQNYGAKEECELHGPGIIGGSGCVWFPNEHPYFKTNCLTIEGGLVVENIGQDCIEGAGCYLGCQGQGFRSHLHGDLAVQWVDKEGNKHGYDAPGDRFLEQMLECCHTQNCNDYDFEICNEFVDTYKFKSLNYNDRYTFCNICDLETLEEDQLIEEQEDEVVDCEGCILDDKCYPFNNRKSGEYCSIENVWEEQQEEGKSCENNFECESNLCIDEECISGGLFRKILNWFRNLFG